MRSFKYRLITVLTLSGLLSVIRKFFSVDMGFWHYLTVAFVGMYIGNMLFHMKNGVIVYEYKSLDSDDDINYFEQGLSDDFPKFTHRFKIKFLIVGYNVFWAEGFFQSNKKVSDLDIKSIIFEQSNKKDILKILTNYEHTVEYKLISQQLDIAFKLVS